MAISMSTMKKKSSVVLTANRLLEILLDLHQIRTSFNQLCNEQEWFIFKYRQDIDPRIKYILLQLFIYINC